MKICSRCEIGKPLEDFHRQKTGKYGRNAWCKECKNRIQSEHRQKPGIKEKRLQTNRNNRTNKMNLVMEYLECHPCVDCGETDLMVLEFDHRNGRDGSTVGGVSYYASTRHSVARVIEEIEKCDVRCSNCHTKITHKRANSWRYRYVNKIL